MICTNSPITLVSFGSVLCKRQRQEFLRVTFRERAERESEKRVSLLDLLYDRERERERDNSEGGAERQSEKEAEKERTTDCVSTLDGGQGIKNGKQI